MGDTTDDLIKLATEVCAFGRTESATPPKRELDQLLATGEQVTIALMAMAIHAQGQEAISFTGGQIGLVTDGAFSKARIQSINKQRIFEQLSLGKIVIVAGFQGVTPEGDYTTLGRGGSNATLVALGAVLEADVCENYTDVDGIFTADPRIVKNARKIERISYDEMLELSGLGASVLQTRAVEFAKKYNVPIHVRNSQNDHEGTWIVAETPHMEHIVVSGTALKKDLIRVTVKNVPDRPGVAATIFGEIAAANIVVDDIIQTVSDDNTASISFTVEHGDLHDIKPVVEKLVRDLGAKTAAIYQDGLAKVSAVGVGMRVHTGVAQRMFKALADAKINIQNITTSEIKISCIITKDDASRALQIVHDAFNLGAVK
jgi:aspartate kinase